MTSTHPSAVGRYFGNKPYLTEQQRAVADRLYLGGLLDGQLSNREVVAFSRRLLAPDGKFGGIVVVSVLPSFFTQHYAEPILGEYGFVALVRNDGRVLASRSGSRVHSYGAPFLLAPLPIDRPAGVARFEGRRWFADGRARVVDWRPFPDLGLIGIVGVDEYSALAAYRVHRHAALAGAWWNTA